MRRRDFLISASTSVTVSLLAGCAGVFGNSNGNTGGPATGTATDTVSTTARNMPETTTGTSGPEPGDVSASISQQRFISEVHPSGTEHYMAGVIENTGKVPLAGPEVSVEFYDKIGTVIGVTSAEITHLGQEQLWDVRVEYLGTDEDPEPDSGLMEFGTAEPWSTYSLPEELEIVSETLENTAESPTETTATEMVNTTTETPTPSAMTDKPLVTGEVRNTGNTSLSAIFAHADFIAENDHVLDSGETAIAELESGASTSFEIEYPGFDEERIKRVSDYELYFVF